MMRHRTRVTALTALLAAVSSAPALAGKPSGGGTMPPSPPPVYYQLTWLGTLGGASSASGINGQGQVVGTCYDGAAYRPFVYTPGSGMQDLNLAAGAAGVGWQLLGAGGINDRGQIVGRGVHDGAARAFRYSPPGTDPDTGSPIPARIEDLGVLAPTHDLSTSGSVNGWGDAAGLSRSADGSYYAFLNTAEAGTIPILPDGYKAGAANAPAVNAFGQVVGQFTDGTRTWAYRYSPTAADPWQEFGPLVAPKRGYGSSLAIDINDYGAFCGSATVADGSSRAFRYTDAAGMTDIGAGSGSRGFGISNPDGQGLVTVVGYLGNTTKNGTTFTPGFVHRDDWGVVNLDRCVTGSSTDLGAWNSATIIQPYAVNDVGQICGYADRSQRAFLLTPLAP